jgi:hypothetical protein
MTKRSPVSPVPGPLENYAACFDRFFGARAQPQTFRRHLEGLLLPTELNKTLTALANTDPVVGEQHRKTQSLQWILSECTWEPEEINRRWIDSSNKILIKVSLAIHSVTFWIHRGLYRLFLVIITARSPHNSLWIHRW